MGANFAQTERHALCDLLESVGPDAPTLCGGWRTRDLAAHLAIRDSRPDLAAGMFVKPLAARLERAQRALADSDWSRLVDRVRNGPPTLSPLRVAALDSLVNTGEYFIHHEDVRRAQPQWEPRDLHPELEDTLRGALGRMGKLLFRASPVGVTLVVEQPTGQDTDEIVAKRATPQVRVVGRAGEIALFAFGRQGVAQVELSGDDAAVERLRRAQLGV